MERRSPGHLLSGVNRIRDDWTTDWRPLALGDLVCIVALILYGQYNHGIAPHADPLRVLEVAFPFVFGWLLAVVLLDLYRDVEANHHVGSLRSVVVCWLAAANVGFLIRGTDVVAGGVSWSFIVVLSGFGLVVLLGWRMGYVALIRSQRG